MKKIRFAFSLILVLLSGLFIVSCGSKSTTKSEGTEAQGKEYTSAYICPMHCAGSGSDEPGTCPVCKMDYEKNPDHQSDDHGHDHEGHEDHNH